MGDRLYLYQVTKYIYNKWQNISITSDKYISRPISKLLKGFNKTAYTCNCKGVALPLIGEKYLNY